MTFRDTREFVSFLEEKGELRRVKTSVSCELEITELADRAVKSGGPALFFENVEGYDMPVVIGLFGTHQRMAWALGVDHLDELTERVRKILALAQGPPSGLVGKARALGDLVGMVRTQPKTVTKAPCQEEVVTGDEVDVNALPALKCWPEDAGRFITLPLVISRDPETGRRNVGTYRMQIYDGRTTGMHWQTHKVGAHHYRTGEARGQERLDVAVALGADPTTMWTGSLPLPPDMDEIMVSGIIREQAVEMVKCVSVDLEVPAHAEIVLEGYVVPGELRAEGPFGDHTGYYSPAEDYPVFHVTAMTHRPRPNLPDHHGGQAPDGRLLHGKGQRAADVAGAPDDPPGGRRYEHAGRGHIPQPGGCLDQKGVPGTCPQGHVRPLGTGSAHAGEDYHRCRPLRGRAQSLGVGVEGHRQYRPIP